MSYLAFLTYVFVIITYRFPGAGIAMAVALGALVFERRWPRVSLPILLFGAFLAWGYFVHSFSPFPEASSTRLELFLRLGIIFFVAFNVLTTPARIRFFLVFLVVLFVTHPLRGAFFNSFIYGYAHFDRVLWRDSFGNPNDLAALSLLPLGIAAALLRDGNKWVRWGALASVVLIPALVLLTQSRGGILALALFGALALLAERRRLRTFAVAGVLALATILAAPSGAVDRMSELFDAQRQGDVRTADSSADQRMVIWEVAVEVIADHPVTGVGLGSYPRVHEQRVQGNPQWELAAGPRDIHSTYLGVLAETGWPGLAIFLALLGAVIVQSARTRKRIRGADADRIRYVEIALYAFLVAGVFATFSHLTFLYLHLALLLAMCRVAQTQSAQAPQAGARLRRGRSARPGVSAASATRRTTHGRNLGSEPIPGRNFPMHARTR